MNLIVIHCKDNEDKSTSVIGVANSIKMAEYIIEEYFGKGYEVVNTKNLREGTLEYSKVIETEDLEGNIVSDTVVLEWFVLNKV
jgi:hypothetical protein